MVTGSQHSPVIDTVLRVGYCDGTEVVGMDQSRQPRSDRSINRQGPPDKPEDVINGLSPLRFAWCLIVRMRGLDCMSV